MPPATWRHADLLILYVTDRGALRQCVDALRAHGGAEVRAANPYWDRMGHTVVDPDGYRVVLAVRGGTG